MPRRTLVKIRLRSFDLLLLLQCASFEISAASNSAELRSIASLRAANFFDIATASCSEFAARVSADHLLARVPHFLLDIN